EDVYRHIRFFTGSGRSTFERWLRRSGRYMSLFRDVLQKEGLPPDLVHLVFVESGFNVHARSYAAAVGPWQFLQGTARMFGLTVNQWVDERRDPEKATVAAARYLKHLYTIFGDWPLALASYNAGEGTVLRAIKNQGTTNYWDLRLPKQTEEYVPGFMAVLAITRDPDKYGFHGVELEDPMDFDELALKGRVDLRALAKLAGCTYEDLKVLNPAVLRHTTPVSKDGVSTVRVPRGAAEVILQAIDGGVKMPEVDLTVKHRVRRNETMRTIASQYGVDATRLARQNGITSARPLKRGMVLTVRSSLRPATLEVATLEPNDPRASTDYVPALPPRAMPRVQGASDPEGRSTITVRRGQTLVALAEKHSVSAAEIRQWNRLKTDRLRPGQRLKVRTAEAVASAAERAPVDSAQVAALKPPPRREGSASSSQSSAGATSRTIRVRSGDTLSEIAARNGTTVARLKALNGMRSNTVRIGQRLRVPS
ncbi:MAG: LysM peptidoglycan-binding domain-containing protein, partial [Candidatus Eisenbacteria bacterium]|nr:LysM peptidoglycan-binding domain-containing protein [Candidatus Eisenbacteria bacterium]